MKITFRLLNQQRIKIMNGNKEIGQIFTPSGSNNDTENSIQVCGFDWAFDLWGCGVYGDGRGHSKKDIQLLFNEDSCIDKIGFLKHCCKCFYPIEECKCHELVVIRKEQIKNGKVLRGLLEK